MAQPKVLLVGWDAADWKVILPLMERGEMPNLARFVEQGVMGDITTLEPVLSPMLWNSIGTGKYADAHGILGFTEVDPHTGKVRPVTSTSRKTKALWNILSQAGFRTNVITWFGGHPAEPIRGVCVSDALTRNFPAAGKPWPMIPGSVHPPELADTLSEFRVRPDEIDVSMITTFVPKAAAINQDEDRRLEQLAKLIAEASTVHSCATYVMHHHPWDFMAIYYPTIDHFSHAFMSFHPPRLDWVDEKLFEVYQDVLNGGYRLHDLMLGALLRLVPEGTTTILVSDHGFHSDHLRPKGIPNVPAGPAEEHRPIGVFAMSGPGITKDERVYGVGLLDVAPTVLTLFGLSPGEDMPGRVLLEAMEHPPRVRRIPSWDAVDGEAGMHKGPSVMAAADADAMLEQFIALGYVERPEGDATEAARNCTREQKWNLARVYSSTRRYHLALPLLEEISDEAPDRADYWYTLSVCQAGLGMFAQARASMETAIDKAKDSPGAQAALAAIAQAEGKTEDAMALLEKAAAADPASPSGPIQIGMVHFRARQWEQAKAQFRRALELDPHNVRALQVLARTCLRRQEWEEAAVTALEAVGYQHDLPYCHLILGIALLRLNRTERAIQAFQTCLSFHPPLRAAHFWLARTLMQIPGRQMEGMEQREKGRTARRLLGEYRDKLARVREETIRGAEQRAIERAERKRQAAEKEAAETAAALAEGKISEAQAKKRSLEFVLVSGLPRSGTSLMMQMLAAGGLDPMSDGLRKADDDNPEGYFEWEAIRKVKQHPEILYQAEGRFIKVISMLLAALPRRHRYKVIFMNRPVEEVAASQVKMLRHRNEEGPAISLDQLQTRLERHRSMVLRSLRRSKKFEVLVVDYPALVLDPEPVIARLVKFLPSDRALDQVAMAAAVKSTLYRNRARP